ncbi:16S rRNA (guanine(966)-N(2))-methyltransferase RsmD [Lolliginicoccus suaedae]|uniref:16S rRNA (guanine(966)-N(2))-methyltransferase RsmD n=1 Tax=Lolliginicoccus suaedae TaxID=2605429 RepID=UPI0011EFE4F4|nr:16S rRNA (guanine(966)-N(2))-methyltransferase RsmD [Lolliginicoccus suaedae]
MTRIIAGSVGGTRIAVPPRGTRPTSDRVREALFSSLDARLDLVGMRVLDLYAGSGALGIEALSRGAEHATLVERDARAARIISSNLAATHLSAHADVVRGDVLATLQRPPVALYDLVLADPPYDVDDASITQLLQRLVDQQWLAPGATVVIERSARSPEPAWPDALEPLRARDYGETRISIAELSG